MSALGLQEKEQILSFLESRLGPQVYDTWCRSIEIEKTAEDTVRVPTANPYHRTWMEKLLGKDLEDAFVHLFGHAPRIVFEVGPESGLAPPVAPPADPPRPAVAEAARPPSPTTLNAGYTFENFVEGPSNRMAYAAALAVSENPARIYNPLFVNGGVGLGKTHLLQAACHAILAVHPTAKLLYVSCEEFVNDYIKAISTRRTDKGPIDAFRARHRNADVLVVDDIHFLANKPQSQEEFFHTFNALHLAGRQVILSSDQPAQDIRPLKEHLLSRFKSGFSASITAPTYETRLAILRRKAEGRGWEIPQDVLGFIAGAVDTNIRDLEGALTTVFGMARLLNKTLDLALAREHLPGTGTLPSKATSVIEIQQVTSRYFGKRVSDMQSRRWTKSTSLARQICIYLCKTFTSESLKELGAQFGDKDHTTILYSIRKVAKLLEKDPNVRSDVERLSRQIRSI